MIYPAAQAVQDEFPKMEDSEAEFCEVLLWYDGFENADRLMALPYSPQDIEIITRKMEMARADKDYRTSDALREVLRKSGLAVKNRNA